MVWRLNGIALSCVPFMRTTLGWDLEVVSHSSSRPKEFVALPRIWVAERAFAWLARHCRVSKDYECLPGTEESFVYAAMVRLMLLLRRLGNPTRNDFLDIL